MSSARSSGSTSSTASSYEAAGTLATLDLPADSPAAYAEELVA